MIKPAEFIHLEYDTAELPSDMKDNYNFEVI